MILYRIVSRCVLRKTECLVMCFSISLLFTVFSNYDLRQKNYTYSGNEHDVIISNYFSVRKVSGITISIYYDCFNMSERTLNENIVRNIIIGISWLKVSCYCHNIRCDDGC